MSYGGRALLVAALTGCGPGKSSTLPEVQQPSPAPSVVAAEPSETALPVEERRVDPPFDAWRKCGWEGVGTPVATKAMAFCLAWHAGLEVDSSDFVWIQETFHGFGVWAVNETCDEGAFFAEGQRLSFFKDGYSTTGWVVTSFETTDAVLPMCGIEESRLPGFWEPPRDQ